MAELFICLLVCLFLVSQSLLHSAFQNPSETWYNRKNIRGQVCIRSLDLKNKPFDNSYYTLFYAHYLILTVTCSTTNISLLFAPCGTCLSYWIYNTYTIFFIMKFYKIQTIRLNCYTVFISRSFLCWLLHSINY